MGEIDLTKRQQQIIDLKATGASNAEVGRQLGVQPQTIKMATIRLAERLGGSPGREPNRLRLFKDMNIMPVNKLLSPKEQLVLLNSTEKRVYLLLTDGLTNTEIANKLCYSGRYIDNIISSIYKKTGLNRREIILSK